MKQPIIYSCVTEPHMFLDGFGSFQQKIRFSTSKNLDSLDRSRKKFDARVVFAEHMFDKNPNRARFKGYECGALDHTADCVCVDLSCRSVHERKSERTELPEPGSIGMSLADAITWLLAPPGQFPTTTEPVK